MKALGVQGQDRQNDPETDAVLASIQNEYRRILLLTEAGDTV